MSHGQVLIMLDCCPPEKDPESSARCLTKSSSASSPASLLLCAHPQSAQSLVLLQSAQSLVLLQSVLSLVLLHSALSHAPLSHASRSVLLCNLLYPASRSAHPRASECCSSHQDQEKRENLSPMLPQKHFQVTSKLYGCRRIFFTLLSPCVFDVPS
ncbi:hypothetical protein LEMLEM_LOCUS9663 [Lemmus lemmus]